MRTPSQGPLTPPSSTSTNFTASSSSLPTPVPGPSKQPKRKGKGSRRSSSRSDSSTSRPGTSSGLSSAGDSSGESRPSSSHGRPGFVPMTSDCGVSLNANTATRLKDGDRGWDARRRDPRANGADIYVARFTKNGFGSAKPCWRCLEWCRWAGVKRIFHWDADVGRFEVVKVNDAETGQYETHADIRLFAGLVRSSRHLRVCGMLIVGVVPGLVILSDVYVWIEFRTCNCYASSDRLVGLRLSSSPRQLLRVLANGRVELLMRGRASFCREGINSAIRPSACLVVLLCV